VNEPLKLEDLQRLMERFPANPLNDVKVYRSHWVTDLFFLALPTTPRSEWMIIAPITGAWTKFSDAELRWFCNKQWPEAGINSKRYPVMTGIDLSTS